MRIIAIEEHCILPQQRKQLDTSWLPENQRRQVDATMGERLAAMDAAGIDLQVLSVPAPQPRVLPAEIVVPMYQDFNNDLHTINSILRGLGLPQPAPGQSPAWDGLKLAGFRAARAMVEPLRTSETLRRVIRRIALGKNANYYYGKA